MHSHENTPKPRMKGINYINTPQSNELFCKGIFCMTEVMCYTCHSIADIVSFYLAFLPDGPVIEIKLECSLDWRY
jgi:hypothetical protein